MPEDKPLLEHMDVSEELEEQFKETVNDYFEDIVENRDGTLIVSELLQTFTNDTKLTRNQVAYVSYQIGRLIMNQEIKGGISD